MYMYAYAYFENSNIFYNTLQNNVTYLEKFFDRSRRL